MWIEMAQEEERKRLMQAQQALAILDQAASRAPLSRQEHVAVQEAAGVLAELLKARATPAGEAPEEEFKG